jgi:hypothetical protein
MEDLFVRIISNVSPETLFQYMAAAGVLGVLMQKVKGWLEIQSSGVLNVLNYVLSIIAVLVHGVLTASATDPTLIPQQAAGLFALIIGLYHLPVIGIKSLTGLIQEVRIRKEQKARIKSRADDGESEELVPIESVVPQFAAVSIDVPAKVTPVVPEEFAA